MADLSPEEVAIAAAAELANLTARVEDAARRKAQADAEVRANSLEHLETSTDPYAVALANILAALEELARKAGVAADKSTPIGARIVRARDALSQT